MKNLSGGAIGMLIDLALNNPMFKQLIISADLNVKDYEDAVIRLTISTLDNKKSYSIILKEDQIYRLYDIVQQALNAGVLKK